MTIAGLEITIKILVPVRTTCLRIWITPAVSRFPVRKAKYKVVHQPHNPCFPDVKPTPRFGFCCHFWVSWKSGNPVISSPAKLPQKVIAFNLTMAPCPLLSPNQQLWSCRNVLAWGLVARLWDPTCPACHTILSLSIIQYVAAHKIF